MYDELTEQDIKKMEEEIEYRKWRNYKLYVELFRWA